MSKHVCELQLDSKTKKRFLDNISIKAHDACWEWHGSISTDGHARICFNGTKKHAARVAYTLWVGVIPPNMFVSHICNNKLCVNPDHLVLITCSDKTKKTVKPVKERFYNNIKINSQGCWIWHGSKDKDGYGNFSFEGEQRAHRVAYKLWIGEIPNGMMVCHHCDTPACVNPEHLFLGTAKDNTQDMIKKGRNIQRYIDRSGKNNGHAKLTEEDIQNIRALYGSKKFTHRSLAKKFNVSRTNIGSIVNNNLWQHVV